MILRIDDVIASAGGGKGDAGLPQGMPPPGSMGLGGDY